MTAWADLSSPEADIRHVAICADLDAAEARGKPSVIYGAKLIRVGQLWRAEHSGLKTTGYSSPAEAMDAFDVEWLTGQSPCIIPGPPSVPRTDPRTPDQQWEDGVDSNGALEPATGSPTGS